MLDDIQRRNAGVWSRSHSATLFRTLEEYTVWARFDPCLVFHSQPQVDRVILSCFLPWKRFDPSFICPDGVTDAADVTGSHAARIGTYQVWLMNMHQQFQHVRVLETTSAMDVSELRQLPVLPLRIVKGNFGLAFVTAVFVSACWGREETQSGPGCKQYNLGKLVFGPKYRTGEKFDVLLDGYWFAVPSIMVKQDTSAGMFFLRTCRIFNWPNIDCDPFECCVDASLSLSAKTSLLDTASSVFSFTQIPAFCKFHLSNKAYAHPKD